MICKDCPEAKRFAPGSVICLFYGMIIREDHNCTLERGRKHERDGNYRERGENGSGLQEDGRPDTGCVPRVLSGSGECGSIFDAEGRRTGWD